MDYVEVECSEEESDEVEGTYYVLLERLKMLIIKRVLLTKEVTHEAN